VYAAYGGVFITLALLWVVVVDGFRPDGWDLLGALICVVGWRSWSLHLGVSAPFLTRVRGRGIFGTSS
jgi:drug/metabolite transporter superfamily protein YnfA